MNKDVRYLIEEVLHLSSIPVYKTTKDILTGIWIIFITNGSSNTYNDQDGNVIEQDEPPEPVGAMVAEVIDYKGKKQFLYNEWASISYDSKIRVFGSKSHDIAETVATRIRNEIKLEDRTVKLVFLEQDRYDTLNREIEERMMVRNYAREIAKGIK